MSMKMFMKHYGVRDQCMEVLDHARKVETKEVKEFRYSAIP